MDLAEGELSPELTSPASPSWLDRLQFRASYSTATSDKLYRGTHEVPNPTGVETEFQQWSASVLFRQDDRHRWTVNLPYMEIEQRDHSGTIARTAGLGDLSVTHGWTPWRGESFELLMGLELPTGKELPSPGPGLVPATLLQPGSGTWDPILGFRWSAPGPGPLVQSAHLVGLFPLGESDAGLDPGNVIQGQYGLGWQLNSRVFTTLGLEGVHRTPDSLLGARIVNTGSTFYSLRPGVMVALGDMNLFVGARLPFAYDVEDTQIAPGPFFEVWLSTN